MMPEEIVHDLVEEHFAIQRRDQEVKEELIATLVDQKMTDFFSVNWRKLHNTFVRRNA